MISSHKGLTVDGRSYSFSRGYDAGNRPLSHTFADGHSQVWTYDARNLVTNLSYDGEQVLAQSHDAGSRLNTQTLGNGLSRQLSFGRSDNLRTSDVTSDTGVISLLAWNYTYKVDKQVTAENTAGSFLDNSICTAIMPSILSRHKVSTFFLQKVILKKAEILSPVVDPGDRLVSYSRSGFQPLLGAGATPVRETENWSYDNAGNHNSVTRDGNTQNRTHNSENCRGIGGILDRSNATCPAGVNLRVEEVNHNELINLYGDATTRDVKGNMTEDAEGNKYFYDLEHGRRIGGWVDKSRSDGGKARASQVGVASHNRINRIEMDGGDTIELEYDAMGRRVFRKNGSDETAFLWWGDQECSEHVSGAGQPVIQNDLWAHPTVLNKICARAVDGDKNDIEWYHKNYLDHVYAVSDENTRRVGGCLDRSKATCPAGVNLRVEEVNHNGNIDEHYRYTAFGEVEIYNTLGQKLVSSAIGNTVLWNSRRFDQDTNLYYYWFRHYKADFGRWLGRDLIEENGGVNLYEFAINNVFSYFDAFGTLPVSTNKNKIYRANQEVDEYFTWGQTRKDGTEFDPRGRSLFESNAAISREGCIMDVIVEVNFQPGYYPGASIRNKGYKKPTQEEIENVWVPRFQKAIDKIWNNKFEICCDEIFAEATWYGKTGLQYQQGRTFTEKEYCCCKVNFVIKHTNDKAAQRVGVFSFPGNLSNQFNWNLTNRTIDLDHTVGHEFGHFLGNLDEYGVVEDPRLFESMSKVPYGQKTPDNVPENSIMGGSPNGGEPAERHLWRLVNEWGGSNNKNGCKARLLNDK